MLKGKNVKIKYRNYKGETKDYLIEPVEMYFGKTEFHAENQWLLLAFKRTDTDVVERTFAMKDIIAWWTI